MDGQINPHITTWYRYQINRSLVGSILEAQFLLNVQLLPICPCFVKESIGLCTHCQLSSVVMLTHNLAKPRAAVEQRGLMQPHSREKVDRSLELLHSSKQKYCLLLHEKYISFLYKYELLVMAILVRYLLGISPIPPIPYSSFFLLCTNKVWLSPKGHITVCF